MSRSTASGRVTVILVLGLLVVAGGCGSDPTTSAGPDRAVPATSPTLLPTTAEHSATTVPPATTIAPTTATTATAPPTTAPTTTAASSSTTTAPPPTTDPPEADAGALPQTRDKPATSSPALEQHTQALWHAIVTDDPSVAMAFFFPKSAYLQVKDIADPAGDYQRRLVAAYEEDIHALHARLGPNPSKASLVGLTVPAGAQWIDPGVEYNKIGYWRVYGTKLAYTAGGKQQEITIASMISWRGQWYVVHLASVR